MRDPSANRTHRPPAHAWLLWLLAFVVPLQCSAALARLAAGPSHVHVAATGTAARLHDFRRDLDGSPAVIASPSAVLAILHGHAHPQRHYHAAGDGSVVVNDGALDRIDSSDDGTGASSAVFAALLPLLAVAPAWQPPGAGHVAPRSQAWAASSRVAALPERPPRRTQV